MKQVSEAYKESMAKPFRNRSHVRVLFSNSDTTILSDGEWVGNGELAMSDTSTLDHNRLYGSPYATLELNRWVLDGSFAIAPDDGAVTGFVSSLISDENGVVEPTAVLTREFSNVHTIPKMTLVFDTRTGIHPNSVTVEFYLEGSLEKGFAVPVTGDSVEIAADIASCDKIVVIFGEMPPYRHPRLEGVTYGDQKVFVDEEIASTKQSHDIDPLSRRLPKETMQFTILDFEHQYDPDNPAGVWKYIAEKSAVGIQFGHELPDRSIEWVAPDYYILDSRPSFANNQATFKATGRIGSMSGTFYKGTIGEKSFYDLAVEVLEDAELPPLPDGSDPWVIDESLRAMYTTAIMPIGTHAECLQLIAHACRCVLRTDEDNIIHIEPFTVTSEAEMGDFVMDFSSISQNSQTMAKIDQLKSVAVSRCAYLAEASKELFSEVVADDNLHVEFPAPAKGISITVNGIKEKITADNISDWFEVKNDECYFELVDGRFSPTNIREDGIGIARTARTVLTAKAEMQVEYSYSLDSTDGKLTIREGDWAAVDQVSGLENVYGYVYPDVGETIELIFEIETSGYSEVCSVAVIPDNRSYISSNYTAYARAVDLEMSSGRKQVTIAGIPLTEHTTVQTLAVSSNGSVDVEKNPLITDPNMAKALASHVAAYLQLRNTYDVSYRGNPELECGDIIGLQTMYTPVVKGLVLTDEITYNGALRGKAKVKMLGTAPNNLLDYFILDRSLLS